MLFLDYTISWEFTCWHLQSTLLNIHSSCDRERVWPVSVMYQCLQAVVSWQQAFFLILTTVRLFFMTWNSNLCFSTFCFLLHEVYVNIKNLIKYKEIKPLDTTWSAHQWGTKSFPRPKNKLSATPPFLLWKQLLSWLPLQPLVVYRVSQYTILDQITFTELNFDTVVWFSHLEKHPVRFANEWVLHHQNKSKTYNSKTSRI